MHSTFWGRKEPSFQTRVLFAIAHGDLAYTRFKAIGTISMNQIRFASKSATEDSTTKQRLPYDIERLLHHHTCVKQIG
jgi:hypothetical protein